MPGPPRITQAPRFTPGQKSSLDEILQMSLQNIKDPYKGFEPIAQQARSRFERETIPSLAERFTSMGPGAQRSSGFQKALGDSSVQLEELLGSLMSQYGQQSMGANTALASLGSQPQFENIVQHPMLSQQRPGLGQSLLGAGAGLAMGGFGGAGGLMGLAKSNLGGGGLGRLFRRF